MSEVTLEKLTNLAKRRGFVFSSSELYGGIGAIYDFGPLGVLLKNNIKNEWWRRFVTERDDVVGIESAVITKREVLKASGHETSFSDPLVECAICHERFRADETTPPGKGHAHKLSKPRQFHLMFSTKVGPVEVDAEPAYLRPETAQGMFTNFKTILETSRVKVPFGIAQVGKSFRNEITTGEWLFRLREFEIAEIEYFVKPGEDDKWFDRWLKDWEKFFTDLGIAKKNLKKKEYPKNELAHYSKRTVDLFYNYPVGWKELAAVANRTDYDLSSHQKASGKDLSYFDEASGKKYIPFVIEPTLGIERAMFAFLADAYKEYPGGRSKGGEGEAEIVLHLHPRLAPIKVAVLPLVHKDGLEKQARDIFTDLKSLGSVQYDESGSIGRRYRRQDEVGTPWCITVDYETKKDKKVTVRDRDTMKQERVKITELKADLSQKLS
jgi:glycyl-tRNA synthetase